MAKKSKKSPLDGVSKDAPVYKDKKVMNRLDEAEFLGEQGARDEAGDEEGAENMIPYTHQAREALGKRKKK